MKSSTSLIDCFWDAAVKVGTRSQMEMWGYGQSSQRCHSFEPHLDSASASTLSSYELSPGAVFLTFAEGAPQAESSEHTQGSQGLLGQTFPRVCCPPGKAAAGFRREAFREWQVESSQMVVLQSERNPALQMQAGTVQGNSLESSRAILHPLFFFRKTFVNTVEYWKHKENTTFYTIDGLKCRRIMDGFQCINWPERMKWIEELEKRVTKISTWGKCRNRITKNDGN